MQLKGSMSEKAKLKKLAHKTAQRYLKSIVVIDDQIFRDKEGTNPFNGFALTKAFAEKGIACAIYIPSEGDDSLVDTCVNLIEQTDAAVIDWYLEEFGDSRSKSSEKMQAIS